MDIPIVNIYIDTYKSPLDSYFDECLASVDETNPQPITQEAIKLVVEFEEACLHKLKDLRDPSRKRFQYDMNWLSLQLNRNIFVYVGHIDMCVNYIDKIQEELDAYLINSLPTIFLIIGCHGDQYAHDYNTLAKYKKIQDKGVVFFGFRELVHIYNGEIYGCVRPHNKIPDMTCDYDTKFIDKRKLLNNDGKVDSDKVAADPSNELITCCQTKFIRFSSIFIEYLNKRECSKFTKEVLLRKIVAATDDIKDILKITFFNDDGIKCTESGNCEIPNPYKEISKLAEKYDGGYDKVALYESLTNNIGILEYDTKRFMERIRKLPAHQRSIFNYIHNDDNSLLFLLCEIEWIDVLLFILKEYKSVINLRVVNSRNENILHKIANHITKDYINDIKKFYEPIKYILEKDPQTAFMYDKNGKTPLFYFIEKNAKPIIQLFVNSMKVEKPFSTININEDGITGLHLLALENIDDVETWLILLRNGEDPNALIADTKEKAIQLILNKHYPPYNAAIFISMCNFGLNDSDHKILNVSKYFKDLVENEESKSLFIETLEEEEYNYSQIINDKEAQYSRTEYNWRNNNSNNNFYEHQEFDEDLYRDEEYSNAILKYTDIKHLHDNLDSILNETNTLLRRCLTIINSSKERKEKTRKRLSARINRTMKEKIQNIEEYTFSGRNMKQAYTEINSFLKGKNTSKMPKAIKDVYRSDALKIMKNASRSEMERKNRLYALLKRIHDSVKEEVNNFRGGGPLRRVTRRMRHETSAKTKQQTKSRTPPKKLN